MNRVIDTKTITIVGAGLAGSLLAVLLSQRGFKVELFERNPDQRKQKAPAGRSINLALAERGRFALQQAGILHTVDRFTLPMRGRMLHEIGKPPVLQPYGIGENEVIWSTHRARLNSTLLDAAEATGNTRIHFGHKLHDIDWPHKQAIFETTAKDSIAEHKFEVIIGADGGGSALREAMKRIEDLGDSKQALNHGYRELTIPVDANGDFALDPGALHIWPRGGFMLIALPNSDRSFTATLFMRLDEGGNEEVGGWPGLNQLNDWQQQRRFMQQEFPQAFPLMPQLERDFKENPIGLLATVRCKQWHARQCALLLGDAAHAVVPFHGQGMNAAFEDCVALLECLDDPKETWLSVFERFQNMRLDNSNAIADMALENYAIMRESVRDPAFMVRKALEHELERRHPGQFIGRYSMVMFQRIPYALAYRRGDIQAGLLDRLLTDCSAIDEVDFEEAARFIDERLPVIDGYNS